MTKEKKKKEDFTIANEDVKLSKELPKEIQKEMAAMNNYNEKR